MFQALRNVRKYSESSSELKLMKKKPIPTDFGAIFLGEIFGHQDCDFIEGKVTRIGPKTAKNFATWKYQELASDAVAKHPEGHQGFIEPIKNAYDSS